MSTVDDHRGRRRAGGSRRPTSGRSARARWRRLILGQTAIDFWGRRRLWIGHLARRCSSISGVSLWQRGLELGIDFEGGVAWDVPADQLTRRRRPRRPRATTGSRPTRPRSRSATSDSGNIIKVQVGDQPEDVRVQLQEAFAEAAGVDAADVSVASVSATWG